MATIHDYARMCRMINDCQDCPLYSVIDGNEYGGKICDDYTILHPAEASAIIDKWCAEHPQKTYLQDFLEKFPNAKLNDDGEPLADACDVYGDVFACKWHKCCDCWNKVMPDEAGKEEA